MFESVNPPFDEFQKMEALVRGIDNMNVNIYRFFNQKADIYENLSSQSAWFGNN
jgi:hypothetical protein